MIVLDGTGSDIEDRFRVKEGANLIGRRGGPVDIGIKDDQVSPRHALLLYQSGRFTIRDFDSCQGTWLNGQSIDIVDLDDGDIVQVGHTKLVFRKSAIRSKRRVAPV